MKTLYLALSLAALGVAGSASAAPADTRIAVSTAGLDLATAEGQRVLDLRILHAASALCGTPSSADARGPINYRRCRADVAATGSADRNRAIEVARAGATTQLATIP